MARAPGGRRAPQPPPRAPGSPRGSWLGSCVGSMARTPRRGWRAAQAQPNEASPGEQVCGARTRLGEPEPAPLTLRQARPTWDGGPWGSCRAGRARGQRQASRPRCPRPATPGAGLERTTLRAPPLAGLKLPSAGDSRLLGLQGCPWKAGDRPAHPTPWAGLGHGLGCGLRLGHRESFRLSCGRRLLEPLSKGAPNAGLSVSRLLTAVSLRLRMEEPPDPVSI